MFPRSGETEPAQKGGSRMGDIYRGARSYK
jgi:hypothetical protein